MIDYLMFWLAKALGEFILSVLGLVFLLLFAFIVVYIGKRE